MNFIDFIALLSSSQKTSLPKIIIPPNHSRGGILGSTNIFWEKITNLRKYTDSTAESFSKQHMGSTGWEYELMMAEFGGQFYYADISTSRDYTQVTSSHSLQVVPTLDTKQHRLSEEVKIDGKTVHTNSISGTKQVNERIAKYWSKTTNAKDRPKFVCHFHSHPQMQVSAANKRIYGFFSPQDITSLLTGSTPLMGLVTDRVWLLVKPSGLGNGPTAPELDQITQTELNDFANLEKKAGKLMNKYGWNLYVAKFKGSFRQITQT